MLHVWPAPLTLKILAGFILGGCLLLTPNLVPAATTDSATLSWTANSESDLAGYNVYQGTTSGSYGPAIDVGNTTIYTAQNLQAGLTYYFATTAYDVSGNESLPSIEVNIPIPAPPSDTTPPSVTLTAPSNSSTVAGIVTLTATATDNVGVVGVQFHLNGTKLGAEDTTNTYSVSWDTTGITPGQYSLTATARDAAGNSMTATPVSVTVDAPPDATPPSVTLTAPSNSSTVAGIVTLTATATDNVGVVGVQFHLNGTNLGAEDTTNTYSVSWDTTGVAPGQYSLTATARDAAGNSMTATPVSVTVDAPPDATPPSIPGTLTAQVVSSSEISLNWTASTDNVGITGYHVFRNGAFIASTTTTSYQDANLVPLTTYTYTVTAWDAAGNESMPATSVSPTTLAVPDTTSPSVTLTAPAQGSTVSGAVTIMATATDNVGVVGVQFHRNGTNLGAEDITNSYALPWDTTTVGNGTYTLTATARDAAGNTTTAASVTVTVSNAPPADTTPPSIPTGMTGTMLSTTAVALSWNTSTDNVQVAGYQVMRNNVPLATTITPSYQDSGLSSGFTYIYTVEAFDQAGNTSGLSNPVSLTISPSTFTLSVSIVGSGTVSSSPGGVSCSSGSCADTFPQGSQVTLSAAPSSGSTFSSWSGGGCSGTGSCMVTLSTSSVSVSANFVLSPPPSSSLSVNPASLTQEEIKIQKKWAKAEKKVPKKLAKAKKLLAKIQKRLAKIETMLIRYADKPKRVARLNKKKEKYSMILAKIQEIHSIN